MSFDASGKIAAAGMSAQRKRLEVIAANLANAKTTRTADGGPYRKKMVVFRGVGLERSASGIDSFQEQFKRELLSVKVDRVVDDTNPPNRVFEPNHPDADPEGYVLYPNINPVDEMVNMLGAARSYESNLEVMKTIKQLTNAALELGKA